eukprot:1185438-Prorocentrum_minimum.AAC.1
MDRIRALTWLRYSGFAQHRHAAGGGRRVQGFPRDYWFWDHLPHKGRSRRAELLQCAAIQGARSHQAGLPVWDHASWVCFPEWLYLVLRLLQGVGNPVQSHCADLEALWRKFNGGTMAQ